MSDNIKLTFSYDVYIAGSVLCIVSGRRLLYTRNLYIEFRLFSAQNIANDIMLHFPKVFHHHYNRNPTHLTSLSPLRNTYATANGTIVEETQKYISFGPYRLLGLDYHPFRTAQSRSRIVDSHAFACAGKH
jgi:hypothetical protein